MADLGNQKIKDTYQFVLQTDPSGNLQNLTGGTPNPLIVNNNLRYLDGNQADGYVLLSDSSGNASWGPVAFSGDVYVTGGSINSTTIQLNVSSGGTVSIPGLSWSSSTSGHISNSGLTGNVGIGTPTPNKKLTVVGDISASTNVYSNNLVLKANAGGTDYGQITPDVNHGTIKFMTKPPGTVDNGESLIISQDLIEAKASPATGTLVSYMKLQPVDGGQDIISFNDANNDIDFIIKSDNQVAFKLDAAKDMMAFRDYVGISNSSDKWPTDTGGLAGTPKYQLRVIGQTLLSGVTTPLEVMGNISGTTDLYLGSLTHTASTITAENKLTIKGHSSTNDYLTLENDYIHMFIDGASAFVVQNTPGDGQIILNASSKNMDTKIVTDDGTNAVHVDAALNLVRVRNKAIIGPGTPTDYNQSLYVSGSSLFYSGGTNHTNEGVVAVGNISGTTNLYIDDNMYSGTTNLLDIFASSGITNQDVYWSANTLGISNSGLTGNVGIGTSTPNKKLTVVGDISGTTDLSVNNNITATTISGATHLYAGDIQINSSGYVVKGSDNRMFFPTTDTSSVPNLLYGYWGMLDSGVFSWGTGEDLKIYHTGSSGLIDNNTGSLTISSSDIILGDAVSEVEVRDNLTVNDDLTVHENLKVNTDTLYVDSSNSKVGVKTSVPDANLTVSGITGFTAYPMNGGTAQFSEGFTRVRFAGGTSPYTGNLSGGDQIQVYDGDGNLQTVTVDYVGDSDNFFLTSAFPTTSTAATAFNYNGATITQVKVYKGTDPVFQVVGESIFSGTTNLLDIFGQITADVNYWSGNTDGSISNTGLTNVSLGTSIAAVSGLTVEGNISASTDVYCNKVIGTNITIDASGDITLDADGADIVLSDGGTDFGRFKRDTSDFVIKSETNNKDIIFKGQDGGSTIAALTLDMSEAGTAIFNHDIVIADDAYIGSSSDTDAIQIEADGDIVLSQGLTVTQITNFLSAARLGDATKIQFGAGYDAELYVSGDDFYIDQTTSDKDIIFKGTDGASDITALTLDMSEAGKAIFNAGATFGAEVAMGTNKITGVGDPTAAQDVTTKTYVENNGRYIQNTTFSLKILSSNNWVGFNASTGGLNSSGFFNTDTGASSLVDLYSYYDDNSNVFFMVPYAGKIQRLVIQGGFSAGGAVNDNVEVELAKASVSDGGVKGSWSQVTGFTKTLPDSNSKRFIWDAPNLDTSVSQYDVFLLAFKGEDSINNFITASVIMEFTYTIT